MKIRTIVAINLKKERRKKAFTQSQMAKKLEVSAVTYNNWENERAWPQPELLERFAAILDIDPQGLFLTKSIIVDVNKKELEKVIKKTMENLGITKDQ